MGVENCPAPWAERHARRACSSCDCSSSCQPAPFLRKWFTAGAPYLPRHGVSFVCHPPDTSCSSATDPCPATDASVCSARSLRLEPACLQLSTEAWNAPRLHCRAGLTLSHAAHTVSSACGGPSSPASAFAALLYARGPLTSEVQARGKASFAIKNVLWAMAVRGRHLRGPEAVLQSRAGRSKFEQERA